MTLKNLLEGVSTERQYELLALADLALPTGRYYGGKLSDSQIEIFQKVVKR